MKILILSRKRSLYSTKRLREEGHALGHEIEIADPLKCVLRVSHGEPSMIVGARTLRRPHAVLPRIGTAGTAYSIAVVRHFELMGVPVVNRSTAIEQAKNKLACLQVLAGKGVPVPDTLMSRYPRNLDKLMKLVHGPPLILKLLRGTQGTGVIFAESKASVESMLETIWSLGEDIMIQRFIAESKGKDLRVLVIDGKVRAAMRRIAAEGEFRSNIHRCGTGEPFKLTALSEKIAVKAAAAAGLQLAGVDILESSSGPMVIEVNASPGFEGLEEATKRNIAKMFVEAAVRTARKKS
ncbi:MAG: RimK family alpha-L-glutamate ligase [Planctomycetota bacterium]|nr:MAG: RimK family alpha-L-glutamate ligase [Planctomycetota bacterium]